MTTTNEQLVALYREFNDLVLQLNDKTSLLVILRRHPTTERLDALKRECDTILKDIERVVSALYTVHPHDY